VLGSREMRTTIPVVMTSLLVSVVSVVSACGGGESAGAEEARRQAEAEQKTRTAGGDVPAVKLKPPVPGETKIPCEQLIDAAAFQAALGEKEPFAVHDMSKSDAEAASKCALMRGGKRPNDAEQKAALKKDGHLGVLPGDEACNVTAYCYTIEDADRFRKKCAAMKDKSKDREDETMGSFACVHIEAVGENDVQVFRFFDADTKCILRVGGGPGMVDNDYIRNCAKAARDSITPEKIAVTAAPAK